jgi:nucleotide-binding universal stress UspA family protein
MVMTRRPQFIVAYDFSSPAEEALIRAIDAASRAPEHVLHIVAAIDPSHGLAVLPTRDVTYRYAQRIQDLVAERVAAALAGRDVEVNYFVHARIGKPADEILSLAAEIGADLVFVGSHGRTGLQRALLGSISEQIVREAQCPVLVARGKGYRDVELKTIVAETEHAPHHYARPHRYSYIDNRVITRPDDWPL